MSQKNIYLVGLMAVGKSTVGRLLAEALHLPFYDTDEEIEARAGAEVVHFGAVGEDGDALRNLTTLDLSYNNLKSLNGVEHLKRLKRLLL